MAMAPMMHQHRQMLLAGVDGRTLCLRFGSGSDVITGCEVAAEVLARTGIPLPCQRLVTGTTVLTPDTRLTASPDDGLFPSCTLLLRLRGGKGGFGSLLRGAATKAGQKKTSNFDACRDMSGRRLRHVNAEKKLKEWKADAEERELEKTAEEFLKKDKKAKEENSGVFKELERFRAETSRNMEEVGLAVASGLLEARKTDADGKRKVVEDAAILAKRARIWLGDDDEDEDDDIDEEDMEEDDSPTTSGGAGDTGVADVGVGTPEQAEPALASSSSSLHVKDDSPTHSGTEAETLGGESLSEVVVKAEAEIDVSGGGSSLEKVIVEAETAREIPDGGHSVETVTIEVTLASQVPASDTTTALVDDGPLVFEDYQSPKEMEALGMEKLKVELQARGLKCGGSVSERAGRLFLLKSIPLEKLDKKHFAAKPRGSKK